jgi:hypothetical protein
LKTKGKLAYNYKNDRYGILTMDLWKVDGLHCGETFEVLINGEWVADRIEMLFGGEWYLVYSKLKGSELENLPVRY